MYCDQQQGLEQESKAEEVYRVTGPSGPTWNTLKITLSKSYFLNGCKDMGIMALSETDGIYTVGYVAIKDPKLLPGPCTSQAIGMFHLWQNKSYHSN